MRKRNFGLNLIEKVKLIFVYANKGEYIFYEPPDKSKRLTLNEGQAGEISKFLKANLEIAAEKFEGKIIGINLPIKVDYKVTEAPPNVKGNTASGGTKQVTIETGAVILTPLFIESGDIIKINTQKGEYVERVEKNKE